MLIDDEKLFETQVERILQSDELRGSEVLRRLLRFLADKSVCGQADQLKEYIVAIEGLGKPPSYDPRQNSAVRIQAGRLRQKLSQYYRAEGKEDHLVIELPKGRFKLRCEQRFVPQPPVRPRIFGEQDGPMPRDVTEVPSSSGVSTAPYPYLPWLLALIAGIAALLFWTEWRQMEMKGASLTAWSPALEELWAPMLSSKRPLVLVIEDPLFVEFRGQTGIYYRDRALNEWNGLSSSPKISALKSALQSSEIQPSRYYTAFGEVDASFLLARLLAPRITNLSVIKSSQLSWRQLADNNVLFVGVQNLFFDEQLQGLPLHPQLIPVIEGVRNLHPLRGEPAIFADQFLTAPSETGTAYALVTHLPGPVGSNEIESFTSNRSAGYVGAIQWFTDPRFAKRLTAELKRSYGGRLPSYFQVLLKVDFKDNVPTVRAFLPGFAYQCAGVLAGSVVYIEAVYAQKTSYSAAMAMTAVSVFVLAAIMAGFGRERKGHEFG